MILKECGRKRLRRPDLKYYPEIWLDNLWKTMEYLTQYSQWSGWDSNKAPVNRSLIA
jgi:hypothetical protein